MSNEATHTNSSIHFWNLTSQTSTSSTIACKHIEHFSTRIMQGMRAWRHAKHGRARLGQAFL